MLTTALSNTDRNSGYKKRFGDLLKYDVEDEINRFKDYRVRLASYVTDAVALMEDAQNKDTKILVEGMHTIVWVLLSSFTDIN
jgi:adenylosuccinate synthase